MSIKNEIMKGINNPYKLVSWLSTKGVLKWMPDNLYIPLYYRARTGKKLDLKNPITFNEKLQWLKINDRNDIYTTLVDKYEVRKYIEEKIGAKYLIPLIGVYKRFDEINFDKLPNEFVLKCTHDSGGLVICKDKKELNLQEAKNKINECLKKNYYYRNREWPYKNVKPSIICEKYMVDESGTELKDYKIYCFNGEPKIIQVDYNRFVDHKRNLYDINWNMIDAQIIYKNDCSKIINKPKKLDEMLDLARILADKYPHVRIDFYSIKNKLYFGEITFYSEGGFGTFIPEKFGEELGKWITLSK